LLKVEDIRQHFIGELMDSNFVTDKTGVKTIEMIGATFEADEPTIFGEINEDYIQRELETRIGRALIADELLPGSVVEVSVKDDALAVKTVCVS
jgi:hypothetical protein